MKGTADGREHSACVLEDPVLQVGAAKPAEEKERLRKRQLDARRAKTDVLSDRKRTRVLATKPRVGWGRLIAQIEAGVHADFLSYFLGLEVENKIGKSGLPVQKSCVFRSASPRPRRCVGEGRSMHL